ncbi:MAG: hypothetical protein FJX75_17880 [Armatimonadetes bacterium]|nr:hypothetical protein [Armatimonadota bacterium]
MIARVFDYEVVAPRVLEGLRRAFPHDTIEVSEGSQGRAYVLVVSSRFNGLTETQRQNCFWEVLRTQLGEEAEAVSLAALWGTEDLRVGAEAPPTTAIGE